MYADLKIDIPTLNGVMVEKFVIPNADGEKHWHWKDEREEFHNFNGMPAFIRFMANKTYILIWFKHGENLKTVIINEKLEHELIADRRKNRNFTKTNSNDKNSSSNK